MVYCCSHAKERKTGEGGEKVSNALCGILPIQCVHVFISVVCYIVGIEFLFSFVLDRKMKEKEIEGHSPIHLVGVFPQLSIFLCVYPCGVVCY